MKEGRGGKLCIFRRGSGEPGEFSGEGSEEKRRNEKGERKRNPKNERGLRRETIPISKINLKNRQTFSRNFTNLLGSSEFGFNEKEERRRKMKEGKKMVKRWNSGRCCRPLPLPLPLPRGERR